MRKRNAFIVIGIGFGDEGKGVTVNHECSRAYNPLVIRFNGGHQVGHTVETYEEETRHHVFSNFGSGTLAGAPTYWSEFCTVNPIGIRKEREAINRLGTTPINIYNGNAMVTTPYDVFFNQKKEQTNPDGSVGVGFGTTIERNEKYYKLHVRDLQYPTIRDGKLKNIAEKYYKVKFQKTDIIKKFIVACDELVDRYPIVESLESVLRNHDNDYHDLVFEGGQGILLDMDHGFFPNVTRSNTTSKNAFKILDSLKEWFDFTTWKYFVTRAYQTRHGNGFMTNEDMDTSYIKENPNETNILNDYQGAFRKGVLDIDLLQYAISCDEQYNKAHRTTLVMTCLDQVPENIPVTFKSDQLKWTVQDIKQFFGMEMLGCYSPKGEIYKV